jgi:hypothetical protein
MQTDALHLLSSPSFASAFAFAFALPPFSLPLLLLLHKGAVKREERGGRADAEPKQKATPWGFRQ